MYKKTVVNAASEKPLPIMATTERKEVRARRKEKTFMTDQKAASRKKLFVVFRYKKEEGSMLLQTKQGFKVCISKFGNY